MSSKQLSKQTILDLLSQSKSSMANQSSEVSDITQITDPVLLERLRQAQWSFNLAYAATVAFVTLGFTGAIFFCTGNLSEGRLSVAGGLISGTLGACWLGLAKDANDRLDNIFDESV